MMGYTKATDFMRDNVSGNLVKRGDTTKSGGLVYYMETGPAYRLSAKEAEVLGRYNFRPRFVEGATK